jgi:hypothetical protein
MGSQPFLNYFSCLHLVVSKNKKCFIKMAELFKELQILVISSKSFMFSFLTINPWTTLEEDYMAFWYWPKIE